MFLNKKHWYARAALALPLLLGTAIAVPLVQAGATGGTDVNTAGVFQLDGNVTTTVPTAPAQPYDWATLFNATGVPQPVTDLVTSTFIPDAPATLDFALTRNTKDTNDLTTWDCKVTPVTPKNELQNAYAAAFIAPTTSPVAGDLLLYMALERGSVNGTSNAGFWLLRNRVVCDTTPTTPNFGKFVTPTTRTITTHATGDEFLFASFTAGGTTVTVQLFKWSDACTGTKTEPTGCVSGSATGGLSAGTAPETGKACPTTNTNLCGISNATTPISTPWAPGTVGTNGFFEAGVDLTKELGTTFLTENGCFSTFMADTRSSGASVGNEGHDFSLGAFSLCRTPTLTTTQSVTTPVTGTPPTGIVGATTGDTATLSGFAGSVATETVTFKLFGPTPIAPTATTFDCSPTTTLTPVFTGTGTLDSTGVASVTDPTPLTTVGTYYWVAYYTGDTATDGLNNPAQSGCTTEPVTIVKASPTITTTASTQTPTPGVVGSAVTTSDTATLVTAYEATGTVTFELLPPNGTTTACGTPAVTLTVTPTSTPTPATSVTATVTATQASTGPVTFVPAQLGTYHWVAKYTGDARNEAFTGLATCTDAAEAVSVTKATPTLSTIMFLGDIANVTGGYAPAGTIVFTLYPNASCPATTPTAKSWTVPLATGTASTLRSLVTTTRLATAMLTAPGTTYSWEVKYVDRTGLNTTVTTTCGTESVTTSGTPTG